MDKLYIFIVGELYIFSRKLYSLCGKRFEPQILAVDEKIKCCVFDYDDGDDGDDDDSVQVLDLETGRWEDGPSLPSPR